MTSKTFFFRSFGRWGLAICCLALVSGCGGGSNRCDGYSLNGDCIVTASPQQTGPSVSGVSPNSGPASGGTTVIITGNHFTDNNQTPIVLFVANGQPITAKITQSGNTSLTVISPPGTGTVDVVVNGIVYSALTDADHFTYH